MGEAKRYVAVTFRYEVPAGISDDDLDSTVAGMFDQDAHEEYTKAAYYLANCSVVEGWPVSVEATTEHHVPRKEAAC